MNLFGFKPTPQNQGSSNNWTESEIQEFMNKLVQVIAWTEKLAENFDFENGKYGLVFRQTNPEINGLKFYNFEDDYATWSWPVESSLDNFDLMLHEAIRARSDGQGDLLNIDAKGRILCFETGKSTFDGAPIAESKHFVDEGDAPPIDTWFFLKRNYHHSNSKCEQSLFCWIPKPFEKVMQQAIDVEIFDSYRWLDENDTYMHSYIKKGKTTS